MKVTFSRPDVENLRKEYMLIDMHFHTRFSHDCGTRVKTIIDHAKKLGVHVAITDHNEIRGAMKGAELCPEYIHPGIEITTREGKDILVYFYNAQDLHQFFHTHIRPMMKNKSSIRSGRTGVSALRLFKILKQYKCVVALPHPFAVGPRQSYQYFRRNGTAHLMQDVHAIEVVNQAVPHKRNLSAIGWAAQTRKTMIGGSDGHIVNMLGSAFTYAKADSWEDFLRRIRRDEVHVVGEEKKLRHHVANMARVLHQKTRVLSNRKIRNGR